MKSKLLKNILASISILCLVIGMLTFVGGGSVNAADDSVNLSEIFDTVNSSIVSESVAIPSTVKADYRSGIKFKLNASGSYIDYSRIIDLRKVEGNLIEIVPNADTNAFGLKSFRIRLTDAYDASNSITVTYEVNRDGPRLFSEGDTTQIKGNHTLCCSFITIGFMDAEGGYANYQPEQGIVVGWAQNFLSNYEYQLDKEQPFIPIGFSYDFSTNCIYTCLQDNDSHPEDRHYLMLDLDNVDDDYPDFAGFTTGEVMLTIESTGSSGEFVVTKIGNDIMADLIDGKISESGLMFGGYDFESMVNGVVNYPYPMPVSANKNPVTAKLEKQDGENWTDVTSLLTEDGTKFTPTSVGRYRLTYTGKTNSGADASVSGEFNVIASPVEITEKEAVSLTAEITKTFVVPEVEFEGGIGKLSTEYSIVIDGKEERVDVGFATLLSQKGTTIKLKVKVTDQVTYSKTFEYVVAIDENVKQFEIDGYNLITVNTGDKITVPDFIANDWSKDEVPCKNEVTITSSLASGNLSVGSEITVDKTADIEYTWGEEKIAYHVVCAPKSITLENISQLFYSGELASIETTSIGTEFTVSGENQKVYMPNPVSTKDLVVEYSLYNRYGLESKTGYNTPFTAVKVILRSLSGNELVVYIDKANALRPAFYINGTRAGTISTYSDGYVSSSDVNSKNRKFSFSFDEATSAFYDGNGTKIKNVTNWSNGLPFDGFTDGKAYVSFELEGGQNGNKLVLNTLSNQKFAAVNLTYGDMGSPALSLKGELKTSFVDLNTELKVPMAYAYDVICNKSSISMTVTTPDGTVLNKVAPQEYELTLSKSGKYVISYTLSDKNRNSTIIEYTYRVLDKQVPVITIDGSYKDEYFGKVTVLSASVSDNNDTSSTKASLYVMLEKPDLTYTIVSQGETLNLSKGKYAVVYYAFDTDGNFTLERCEFEVK